MGILVGISGRARHGKDTVADYLVENFNFKKFSLATQLKHIVESSYAVDKADIECKSSHYRSCLQSLGHFMRDLSDKEYWIKLLTVNPEFVKTAMSGHNIVISDVRYVNEANWVKRCGGRLWRVERVTHHGALMCFLPESQAKFPSEVELDRSRYGLDSYDYILVAEDGDVEGLKSLASKAYLKIVASKR